MFSLNLANVAIGSALAIMPLSFSELGYDDASNTIIQSAKSKVMDAELRETIIVAETLLGAFYMIASSDHTVFDRFKADIAILFQQADFLSKNLHSHSLEDNDLKLLQSYTQTLEKTRQLYKAVEYKKEADRVLLSRANGDVAVTFDGNSTDDDIRRAIFGA